MATKGVEEPVSLVIYRLKLLLIYITYLVFIGVPLWFYTTSIYQSDLPIQEIRELQENSRLSYDIPIHVKLQKPLRHLIGQTQGLIDEELGRLGVDVAQYHISLVPESPNAHIDDSDYELILDSTATDESFYIDPFGRSATLFLSDLVVANGKVADFIMRVVVYDLFYEEIESYSRLKSSQLALPYSDEYNLVISLVVEDGSKRDWAVSSAVDGYLINFVDTLKSFTNFTINTQIQYFCESDLQLDSSLELSGDKRVLSTKDLSTFVDFDGWGLNDLISLKPSINFVIYIPKSELVIENSKTNSFIIPQWGAVKILNTNSQLITKEELLPVFEILSSQLLTLLNFPNKPKSLQIRLDMIKRMTTLHNFKKTFENLNSLIKLIEQLLDIPIPEATLGLVKEAMESIEKLTQLQSVDEQILISNRAVKSSNDAFFQRDMIQQNYFPQSHKFTIYLPIVGPFFLLLITSSKKCWTEYKKLKLVASGDVKR